MSLFHHERGIVDDIQPRGIVIRKIVEVGRNPSGTSVDPAYDFLLLQMSCVCPIPPHKTHDDQECAFRPVREDIRPLGWILRQWVLIGTAPLRLKSFPPLGNLDTKLGNREGITPRRVVRILEIFLDLGWTVFVCQSRSLRVV